jgi:RNA polymerase sigma-70 factor (ECF subfamily)
MHRDAERAAQSRFDVGSTDVGLLLSAEHDDEDAWQTVVQRYLPLIYAGLRRAGASMEVSRHLAQETLSVVAQNLRHFDKRRPDASFRGWLWVVTQNKLKNHYRRNRSQAVDRGGSSHQRPINNASAPHSELPTKSTACSPESRRIQQCLVAIRHLFTEPTWSAFWLMAVEEVPSQEVGVLLNMSAGSVHLAKLRVMRRLQQELGKQSNP